MKRTSLSLLAGMSAVALTIGSASAQTILFQDTFDSYTIDPSNPAPPTTIAQGGKWTQVSTGSSPGVPVSVVYDTENAFGKGTDNQILRINDAVDFSLTALHLFSSPVITFSFDLILDPVVNAQGHNQFINSNQLFAGDGSAANSNRAHLVSPRLNANQTDGRFHGISTSSANYLKVGQLHRIEVVVNISDSDIFYNGVTLASGGVDSWVDGVLIHADSSFARQAAVPGEIQSLRMGTFSNNVFSGRFDDVTIYDGAFVIPEPSTYALIFGGLALAGAYFIRRRKHA